MSVLSKLLYPIAFNEKVKKIYSNALKIRMTQRFGQIGQLVTSANYLI